MVFLEMNKREDCGKRKIRRMEDRDWHIIKALHREQNITKAAQSLYMSQPALTSRLQHIEREFEVRIVHRSTKGIQFTPEGEYLVEQASEMIERLRKIKNEVHGRFSENSGTLEVGASNYFTQYTLPALLEQFQAKYPAVRFRVTTDWSKNIFGLIYNQKLQVGFASVDYGGSKNKVLLYEEPVCAAYRQPFTMKDLPSLPRIDYKSDYLLRSQMDKWWRENFSEPPEISMQVAKLENCLQMVRHGLGYALVPKRILREEEELQSLPLIDKEGKPILRKTWMIYNDVSKELPIVRLFVDFVRDYAF